MKEENTSDLLKKLRETINCCLLILDGAILNNTEENYTKIDSIQIPKKVLEEFRNILKRVESTASLDEMKELLKKVTIPKELLAIDSLWGKLKILIEK